MPMNHAYSSNVGTMNQGAYQSRNAQLNHLVESNLELVESQAKYIMSRNRNHSWLTESDLLSAGYEALVRAARTYNATGEASFKTYASRCIRNEMVAEIGRMFPVKVSDKQREDLSIVRDVVDESDWDIPRPSVFDQYQSETMSCDWEPEYERLLEEVVEAKDRLKSEERELVHYRYGFEGDSMKLDQLAEHYQKTPQAVHKRLNHIHDKLRMLVVDEHLNYGLCA